MKKTLIYLAAALIVSLLSGCAQSSPTDAPMAQKLADSGVGAITVYNVDEFLAAVAPGVTIRLADGDYDLSKAATYGTRSGNPYVTWVDTYDGFQLRIHSLDGLTIEGSGQDTTQILAQSCNAHVVEFEDCTGLQLRGFTAGHAVQAGACSGSVLRFYRCEDVRMERLGLYGCGAVGVEANRTEQLQLLDSDIYDCSSCGVNLFQCRDAQIEDSRFFRIGKDMDGWTSGYAVFALDSCENVTISGCKMEKNNTGNFLTAGGGSSTVLRNNWVSGNSFMEAVFMLDGGETIVESTNAFEDNVFSHWYAPGWQSGRISHAVDERGEALFCEDPPGLSSLEFVGQSVPVIDGPQRQVRAANAAEFLAAIDSNVEILLTGSVYDFTTVPSYGKTGGPHYTWEECHDGPGLIITDVENFSIVAEGEDITKHVITAEPRYADVLTFRGCTNVMLRGFTAGHTQEPSFCAGGVLRFEDCVNCLVEDCGLYGCGILGVSTMNVNHLQIIHDKIYECSYGGISAFLSQDIIVGGCEFWDLGGPTFYFSACENVFVNGQELGGNYSGD